MRFESKICATRLAKLVLIVGLSASAALVGAQEESVFLETDHYRVVSLAGRPVAEGTATKLEAALTLFNDVYRFDTDVLDSKMRVRILPDKDAFDSYLESLIDETRDDFVYIHYSDLAKSELVGFVRDDDEEFDRSLLHLGSIQFLKSFIPQAPIWLREGVAAYLEGSTWDEQSESYRWQPNLVWLDTLKEILAGEAEQQPFLLDELLTIRPQAASEAIDVYYPEAWGLVHFLNESPEKSVNRLFWDSIAALRSDATIEENSRAVIDASFRWVDEATFEESAVDFVWSLNTFFDWVQIGIDAYADGELARARDAFESALELESDNYVPYYYLGLIAYNEEIYDEADSRYRQSLAIADDTALVHYALGVNAFADNRFAVAEEHLVQARELDGDAYGERVETLLERIDVLR